VADSSADFERVGYWARLLDHETPNMRGNRAFLARAVDSIAHVFSRFWFICCS
jgi:hypothetical protein